MGDRSDRETTGTRLLFVEGGLFGGTRELCSEERTFVGGKLCSTTTFCKKTIEITPKRVV